MLSMVPKRTGTEFFTLDSDGNATEAGLHEAILDDVYADAAIGQQA
jgi:hypothetical protein